ncbi:MAG TPA: hypothetical protein VF752_09990 [Thermoleophilaceae bacterium]
MRRKPLAGALACALAATAVGVAAAETVDGVTFTAKTTTTKPATSTGLNVLIAGTPTGPDGKPIATREVTVVFPAGTKINTKAIPQCKATDQRIQSTNGSACPAKSKIGTGTAEAFTDLGPAVDPVAEAIVAFNVPKGIAFLLTPKGPIGQTAAFRGKFSGAAAANAGAAAAGPKLVTAVPKFPIPGGNEAKLTKFALKVKANGKGAKAYSLTPKTCPKSKKWSLSAIFKYDTHAPITVTTSGPCKK